jgi:hypothetical protein
VVQPPIHRRRARAGRRAGDAAVGDEPAGKAGAPSGRDGATSAAAHVIHWFVCPSADGTPGSVPVITQVRMPSARWVEIAAGALAAPRRPSQSSRVARKRISGQRSSVSCRLTRVGAR